MLELGVSDDSGQRVHPQHRTEMLKDRRGLRQDRHTPGQ